MLVDQITAMFHAMSIEMQMNHEMRGKIASVFSVAMLAFDDDGSTVSAGTRRIHPGDWHDLDEAFSDGFNAESLSGKQRQEWKIAYEAARRIILSGVQLP